VAKRPIDGFRRSTYAHGQEVFKDMGRHLHHWLDMVEAVLIIGILLAIAWFTWQAFAQAYTPVFNILNKF
jgi:TRAP-type C4-dicarboxylate transport system permease small subunit